MADLAWINPSIHAQAASWAARVVTNGGAAVSSTTLIAVSNFCADLDAASISNLMISVVVFAPDNLIASITPLYVVAGSDPWTNHNFVVGNLSVAGLKGNATDKYLDLGLNPNSVFLSQAQGGVSLYNTFPDVGAGTDFFAGNGGNTEYSLCCDQTGSVTFGSWNSATRISGTAPTYGLGFFSANRTDGTHANIYFATSTVAFASIASSGAGVSGNPPTTGTAIFAANVSNAISSYSAKRFSFAAVHAGLSSAQAQSLFNAVQKMRMAFGGGYL